MKENRVIQKKSLISDQSSKATKPEIATKHILSRLGYHVIPWQQRSVVDPANTIYEQMPLGNFRLDFALLHAKINIEVDGFWHSKQRKKDKLRDIQLLSMGWQTIRVSARAVVNRENHVSSHLQMKVLSLLSV